MADMPLAVQATSLPTNKLAVGTVIASLVSTYAAPLAAEVWPQIMPAALAGPVMTDLMQAIIGMLAGVAVAWFVRDRANIPA